MEARVSAPSPGYAITMRVEAPAAANSTATITRVISQSGEDLTALDVVESHGDRMVVDVTCNATDTSHAEKITAALEDVPGVLVGHMSTCTFLMHLVGKTQTRSKVPLQHRLHLPRPYTPGVARVSSALAEKPEDARRLTIKRNTVAVVTDRSALPGLGNIGAIAALPVMEGKAALFKRFAQVDAWPVCLDTQDVDEIVSIVKAIAPVYGGINLEDISAPRCFEVERRLREELNIPVFHDDQHGTAIVVLAALQNALRVVGKDLANYAQGVSGVGAAGNAIIQLLLAQGAGQIIAADRTGTIHRGQDHSAPFRHWIAQHTNSELLEVPLREAIAGADVLLGPRRPIC